MKQRRIVPSIKPVTSIRVAGKYHHYFHSEALGNCRAILIAPGENLPRPTAKTLANDEIDTQELIDGLLVDYDRMLLRLKLLPLDAYDEYKAALDEIRRIRDTIYAIEQAQKL